MSDAQAAIEQRLRAENQFKGGASWFYWIAGLSLINSAIMLFSESDWGFIFGLAITQVVDVVAKSLGEDLGIGVKLAAFGFDLLAAGFFVAMGYLAHRRMGWAFIVGMIVYLLDGLLYLPMMYLWGLGFHAFALVSMWGGFQAGQRLASMPQPAEAAPPQPMGGDVQP